MNLFVAILIVAGATALAVWAMLFVRRTSMFDRSVDRIIRIG